MIYKVRPFSLSDALLSMEIELPRKSEAIYLLGVSYIFFKGQTCKMIVLLEL
jgi:hypothetical protein